MAPRVLLAPNAFKGSFEALQVAHAWAETAREGGVEPVVRPMSDGGDGFLAVVRHYRSRVLAVSSLVPDPLGRRVAADWGWDSSRRAAYIESAAAIGLRHIAPEERRPLDADSAGLGRLILAAAGLGVRRVVLGLGGSATVDGGFGMARALGYRFRAADGSELENTPELPRLARIVAPEGAPFGPPGPPRVVALADVDNPLFGAGGAAAVYGPQKGADPAAVERLEAGLERLAGRWTADLGAPADLGERRGAGAAGGIGAGAVAFLGARLASGSNWCARLAGLRAAMKEADVAVTGEGRFDEESARKATGHVLDLAREDGVPAAVVCGSADRSTPRDANTVIVDRDDLPGDAGDPGRGPLGLDDLSALLVVALRRIAPMTL